MLSALSSVIRKDWSSVSRPLKAMSLVIAIKYLAVGFIDPFFSLYLYSFSDDYAATGGWLSLWGFAALLSLIPFMRLADHIRNTAVVSQGLYIYMLAFTLYLLAGRLQNVHFLFWALALHGVALTMVDAGGEAYIRRHVAFRKTCRAFGYLQSIMYLGWILGMIGGGFLILFYGFDLLFLLAVPVFFIASLLLRRLPERGVTSLFYALRKYVFHVKDMIRLIREVRLLSGPLRYAYLIMLFDGLVLILTFSFIPLFAASLNLTYLQIALMMAVMYFPTVFSFLFSEIADRFDQMSLIILGLFVALFTFVMLFLASGAIWIVLLASLISLSMAIIRPAYNGIVTHYTPKGMLGEVSTFHHFMIRIGLIVAPILFGLVADRFGIRAVFLFTAFITLLLILAASFMKGYHYFKRPSPFSLTWFRKRLSA